MRLGVLIACVHGDGGITDSLTFSSLEEGRCIACPQLDHAPLMHWMKERNSEKDRR